MSLLLQNYTHIKRTYELDCKKASVLEKRSL